MRFFIFFPSLDDLLAGECLAQELYQVLVFPVFVDARYAEIFLGSSHEWASSFITAWVRAFLLRILLDPGDTDAFEVPILFSSSSFSLYAKVKAIGLRAYIFRDSQSGQFLSDEFIFRLFTPIRKWELWLPELDEGDLGLGHTWLRRYHDLTSGVTHVEPISILVVDGDIDSLPLGRNVFNCRVWVHPAHLFQLKGLLAKDRVAQHDSSKIARVFGPHAFVGSAVAHQLLRIQFLVPSVMGVTCILELEALLLEQSRNSWNSFAFRWVTLLTVDEIVASFIDTVYMINLFAFNLR